MSFIRRFIDQIRRASRTRRSTDRTVAIACQGGGSHAAFTGGALDQLFAELPDEYRIAGLSGASGGAVAAVGAWYGHLASGTTPGTVLEGLWDDVAASPGWEFWVNELTLMKAQAPGSKTFSGQNPYTNPGSDWGRQQLAETLTSHIDFGEFDRLAAAPDAPALLVSAANVRSGEPTLFRAPELSVDAVIASAAVPRLFEAVEIDGEYYWDGFLAQNPPLFEFALGDGASAVDEIWVIRLTPETTDEVPRTSDGIQDRTQELVENLSITHELRFVERVNDLIASEGVADPSLSETTVRTIELHDEQADLSRLNRRSTFIADLYADGQAEATNFLQELD